MKKKTRKKALSTFITIAMIIFIAWIGISWIEVCCKNMTTCDYADWNFFEVLVKCYYNK